MRCSRSGSAYKALEIFNTDTKTASAGGCFVAVSIQAFFSQNRVIVLGSYSNGVSLRFQIFLYPKGDMLLVLPKKLFPETTTWL